MSDSQTYYYLKMKENFYDRDEIKAIEALPSGHEFVNILLKMYLRSLKRGGKLMVTDKVPYDAPMLANALGHRQETVEKAVALFQKFGLVEITDTYEIYMADIQNFIGKSSTEADRIREYRAGIKSAERALPSSSGIIPASDAEPENTSGSGGGAPDVPGVEKRSTNVRRKNTITRDRDITRDRERAEDAASPTTAVAVVPAEAVSRQGKEDLPPERMALYHAIQGWFEKVPESKALMYKDRAAAGRTGKAIKVIVERCFNHARDGGDPSVVARAMIEALYRAVNSRGREKIRASFTPVSLSTEWIWDALFQTIKDKAVAADGDAIADMLERIQARRAASGMAV